jgi:hypothetical protein
MKKLLFIILVTGAFLSTVEAQDDWHTYPFREITTLVQQEEKLYQSSPKKPELVVSGDPFPSKTLVTFTGAKRAAGFYTRSYIKLWISTRNAPAENADLLVEEFQFKEKGKEYWLPVLSTVAPGLEREVKPGDEIVIYYFYLGGFNGGMLQRKDTSPDKPPAREDDSVRWIFAVERVERPGKAFSERTLESAIDQSVEAGKTADVWLDPRNVKLKAKVVFTGDVREVSGRRKNLRDLWFETQNAPSGTSSLMEKEALFREGDKEYWIILRNRTLDQITEIIGKGGTLYLNTILAGAVKNSGKLDWVFMAGEYSR